MNSSVVCVDASVLIKIPVTENLSEEARARWRHWIQAGRRRVAPNLLPYEVVSILNKKLLDGLLAIDEAEVAMEFFFEGALQIIEPEHSLHRRALQISQALSRRAAYDAHYLALAEELDCELWTADARLYNAVKNDFPLIRMLGG
jgi:predicted nucleic acid-binding protein